MRRSVWPASALLAVLTATALFGVALSVRPPGLPRESDGPREAADRALAHRFYDAANAAIESGDLASLAPLVAPDLLDDATPPPDTSAGATLGRRLRALHATSPALRLAIEALAVDGELVIAHVRAERPGVPGFLGLRLSESPEPWGPIDVLRIAGDRVVELRGPVAGASLLEPTLVLARAVPADGRLVITARRLSLAAGAWFEGAAADWMRLLWVERGAVTVTIGEAVSYPGSTVYLGAAEFAIVPAGVVYETRNDGDEPATLLDLRADRVVGARPIVEPTSDTGGIDSVSLGNVHLTGYASGVAVLSLGRATLAPGARLSWAECAGPVLLAVEAGRVGLDADPNLPWLPDGTVLAAGSARDGSPDGPPGAFLPADSTGALTADAEAPATVLIVTLLPTDASPTTDTPGG
jgi:hypothetical protein